MSAFGVRRRCLPGGDADLRAVCERCYAMVASPTGPVLVSHRLESANRGRERGEILFERMGAAGVRMSVVLEDRSAFEYTVGGGAPAFPYAAVLAEACKDGAVAAALGVPGRSRA